MIIEQHCQVNSHFFYSENLNLEFLKNFKKVTINDIDSYLFNYFTEDIVFSENKEVYINVKTNKGHFLFLTVTSDITKEQILDYLKNNSKDSPIYYFRNVDYFSYGQFGYAENGKIERYLAYNSEAMEDENIVEWIGKPHKWEYATHTFYTKKKLEECQMSFDSDAVCEMIYYYLPFITENLEIENYTIYSKNAKAIKAIKKALNYKYKKVSKNTMKQTYNLFSKFNINHAFINALVFEDSIIMHNLTLCVLEEKEDFKDNEILFYNLVSSTNYDERFSEIEFHNGFVQLINEIPNSQRKTLIEVAPYINKLRKDEKAFFYIAITCLSKKKFKIELLKKGNQNSSPIFIGYNFGKKVTSKIYEELKKHSI